MKRLAAVLLIVVAAAGFALAQTGVKMRRPLPPEYGRIVLNQYSEKEGMTPVVFDHWVHRTRFSCRLCHVDIGFAMKAGKTGIRAADNIRGFYCGTCHNGKMRIKDRTVFESCATTMPENSTQCDRCHSLDKVVKKEYDFYALTEKFPRERFGNGVNWEKAEEDGFIKISDFIEGVSIKRKELTIPKEIEINPKSSTMPDIMFSHKKHTIWNGCELCHPEIFVGVKPGDNKYSMLEIFNGKFCGVCHGSVAFPLLDCQRCHTKPV